MPSEGTGAEDLRELSAQLSDLHIGGSGNSVTINVTVSGRGDSSRAAPAPKAAAKAKAAAKPPRFYVICYSPKKLELKGIWEARWGPLAQLLPGGCLFGSGCRPCRGFDTWEEAVACWEGLLPEESPQRHIL